MKPDFRALRMWRGGFSYEVIGDVHDISAGAAERLVTEQRSEELGLPSPYENPVPAQKSA